MDTYIFSRETRHERKYFRKWKQHKWTGSFIFLGCSGSGKTTFLKTIARKMEENGDNVVWYTGEKMHEIIMNQICTGKEPKVPKEDVIMIEDMDAVKTNEEYYHSFDDLVRKWEVKPDGTKRLILMTATGLSVLGRGYELVPIVPLEITKRTVKLAAKQKGIKLNRKQVKEMLSCKRISEVERKIMEVMLWHK